MHATYPPVIHHHPAGWGAALGVVLGAILAIGTLVVLDRVDLSFTPVAPAGPTATTAEMLRGHLVREHRIELVATVGQERAAALEHAGDILFGAPMSMPQFFDLEHADDIAR